ncbi:MAG: hypothetical protein ACXWWE_03015 [Nitrospira sp.]
MTPKKRLIQHGKVHVREALQQVAETADYFATAAPGRKQSERGALFEVLFDAHIVLSLTGALHQLDHQAATQGAPEREFGVLEDSLTRARANLATSEQVLTHALVTELGHRRDKTLKAQAGSKALVRPLAPVLPFRKPR